MSDKKILWWEDWDSKLDVMKEDIDKREAIFEHLKDIVSICNRGTYLRYNCNKYEMMEEDIKAIISCYKIGWFDMNDILQRSE